MSVTDKLQQERELAEYCFFKFKEAMVAKDSIVKEWDKYMDAYNGVYFENTSKPDYKTDSVSNYIFSTVETIRPIMLDNNPKFEVIAKRPDAQEFADTIDFMLDAEFHKLGVKKIISKEMINSLVLGNSIYYVPWDKKKKSAVVKPISIYNFFPDPLATGIDDMEYGIYADYVHVNILKSMFKNKSEQLIGGSINYQELTNGNGENSRIDNQVLVTEMWMRDWTSVDIEEDEDGNPKKMKGSIRVITCAPELGIILSDVMSPYDDDEMPFVMYKCYDIPGKFWGDGEAKRLISPQTQMNELNNAIIDNAKSSANMPWIVDKNSGIPKGKITNRPGLVIRKNPGTEVRREQPPSMPAYLQNIIENFKYDIEQISGVHDSLKGNSEKGVYTAQGILSLQEAAQARIRIKTSDLEITIANIGTKIFHRIRQFMTEDFFVAKMGDDRLPVFKEIKKDSLKEEYDIRIQAGSTSPQNKSAMFDLMIRLAQTPAEDGLPMVDRQAVLQYMPGFDAKAILNRVETINQQKRQDQVNEQQHVSEHKEMQALLQQLAEQVSVLNKELANLQGESEKSKDEAKLEEIREQAYNQGYEDSLQTSEIEANSINGSQPIPDEILSMIGELSDEELMQLLQEKPELEQIIVQELSNQSGTPQQGLQGGM